MAIVIGGRWYSTEAAYALELGEEALARQSDPSKRNFETDEQLKLVDVPEGRKPDTRELYEQEGAA
jgi:hypothetical protein